MPYNMQMSVGFIGGSGLYSLDRIDQFESINISTPYGKPSSEFIKGKIKDRDVVFLARHGGGHHIPPHRINYRANIWGFKELGVKKIVSINATGGINPNYLPGSIVLVDQVIDMTFGTRQSTFFDDGKVVHIDFTEPFCSELRGLLKKAADSSGIEVIQTGVYICVNGPRLETAQEIKTYAQWGADVVGMTLMPEACLARELEMCFASLCVVTNPAAGISKDKLTVKEVLETMRQSSEKIVTIIENLLPLCDNAPSTCQCVDALKDAVL